MIKQLPSPETIAQFCKRTDLEQSEPTEPREIKRRAKGAGRRFTTSKPPAGKAQVLVNPRSGKVYKTKSKAYGGVLAKYLQAKDLAGYKRELARLWRNEKANEKAII